ncbi:Uncharacterised protein [Klebsiella pneumoniae]|nr:Uncharacterised protein [Klebsiella pneumoniae]
MESRSGEQRVTLLPAQHLAEGNERQTDQRVGIAPLEAVEQRNAQPFAFKTSGALQRVFLADIALNFLIA